MPLTTTSYSDVTRPSGATSHASPGALLMLTCLGALDGTIMLLAATGRLNSAAAAVLVGLTVVSGTGAWIAARSVFAGRDGWSGNLLLLGMAAISIGATLGATWLGLTIGTAVQLHILPKVAGIVLMLVAMEVGGVRLPKVHNASLPALALVSGLLLEGGYWIL
jgi:hypothetical protein